MSFVIEYKIKFIFVEKCGRPGRGESGNADTCGQGGGQKLAKFCGRPLWMATLNSNTVLLLL